MICEHKKPDWRDCDECHVEVYQFIKREEDKVPLINCNLCGESCALCDGPKPGGEPVTNGGLLDAVVRGGWHSTPGNGSGALDDMTSYKFDLCEYCLDWLFASCVLPPEVKCAVGHAGCETFLPAAARLDGRSYASEFLDEKARRDVLRRVK